MTKIITPFITILSHRLLLVLVCAIFLVSYIVTAFFTDEALVTLVQMAGHNPIVMGLFVLIVINSLLRMAAEVQRHRALTRVLSGGSFRAVEGVFDLSLTVGGQMDACEIKRVLAGEGYRVTSREGFVAAVRGISLFGAGILWRSAVLLLFAGVAISLSTRSITRASVIEGELLHVDGVSPRIVERIALEDAPGHWFLRHNLSVTLADMDGIQSKYSLYPPGLLGDTFFYPRYLALAPRLLFSLPGVADPVGGYQLIMLYPPGREDSINLANGYRAQVVMLKRDDLTDPFVSGRYDLHIRLLKEDKLVAEGNVRFGERFEANGFSVALLDSKRFVVTDFVRDYGVLLIWLSSILVVLAFIIYLPLRIFLPRRVMIFSAGSDGHIIAGCCSEGRVRHHEALFHDLLDKICR